MPSPFPGVDPFIEDQHFWPDFHHGFMTYWRDSLLRALPAKYDARLEERVRIIEKAGGKRRRDRQPDIAVERRRFAKPGIGGTAVALKPSIEPVILELPRIEEYRQTRIRILHRPSRELVAVLELLSPDNKRGSGRNDYIEKRSQLLWHHPPIHLVEVDLLLRGQRLPTGEPLPAGHFFGFVRRANERDQVSVYAWTIRDPLPVIPIPLRSTDPDAMSDLGTVFRTSYEQGCYERTLSYRKPLKLPLAESDLRWSRKQVKNKEG
jgi:hypothetical protein